MKPQSVVRSLKTMTCLSGGLLLGVVVTPIALRAADDLHIFSDGEVIDAGPFNDNFSSLNDRIGVYEDSLSVDSAGKIGIGTTGPNAMLGVTGGSDVTGINVQGGGASGVDIARFYKGDGTEVMRIDSDGFVGIGTTAPAGRLEVRQAVTANYSIQQYLARNPFNTSGNTAGVSFAFGDGTWSESISAGGVYASVQEGSPLRTDITIRTNRGNDTISAVTVKYDGSVGILNTVPSYTLDVNGYIRATNVSVSSDARLKTDIAPISDALEGIHCLEGVTYRWKDTEASQDLQVGLIAQDVERCFPEVVSTDDQGMKSVAYDRLVAPLIEAVKAQQSAISSQRSALLAQQATIALLESEARIARQQIAAIEAHMKAEREVTNASLARLETRLTALDSLSRSR